MAEPAHFSNNQHYQFKTDMTSNFDDQITWELPRSSEPWPETVPGSNLDLLDFDSNIQVAYSS